MEFLWFFFSIFFLKEEIVFDGFNKYLLSTCVLISLRHRRSRFLYLYNLIRNTPRGTPVFSVISFSFLYAPWIHSVSRCTLPHGVFQTLHLTTSVSFTQDLMVGLATPEEEVQKGHFRGTFNGCLAVNRCPDHGNTFLKKSFNWSLLAVSKV